MTRDPNRAMAALEIARGEHHGDLSLDLTLARLYLTRIVRPTPCRCCAASSSSSRSSPKGGCCCRRARGVGSRRRGGRDADRLLERAAAVVPRARPARGAVRAPAPVAAGGRRLGEGAGSEPAQHRDRRAPRRRAAQRRQAGRRADVVTEALKLQPGDARLSYLLAQASASSAISTPRKRSPRQLQDEPSRGCARRVSAGADARVARPLPGSRGPPEARDRAAEGGDDQAGQVALLLDTQGLALQELQRHDEAIAVVQGSRRARARRTRPSRGPDPGADGRQPLGRGDRGRGSRADRSFRTTAAVAVPAWRRARSVRPPRRCGTNVPRHHRAGSARRQRAELSGLHVRRARDTRSTRR